MGMEVKVYAVDHEVGGSLSWKGSMVLARGHQLGNEGRGGG